MILILPVPWFFKFR